MIHPLRSVRPLGALSLACASTMIFLVPRRATVATEELIEQAEGEETGLL